MNTCGKKENGVCTCSHFSQPSAKKSMRPSPLPPPHIQTTPPPTSIGSPIKKYAVASVLTVLPPLIFRAQL